MAAAIALFGLSCASGPMPPNAKYADASAAVAGAEATGAKATPEASLYLKMAKDGIATAKQQMMEDENEAAQNTLARAMADAKLARSLTTNAKAKTDADAMMDRIEKLRR